MYHLLLPPLRPTDDGQALHDVHPQQAGSFGRFAFKGPLTTCAMPLASETRVCVAGSSSQDMRSEDASFASAVTVAYSEGLDELIVFFDRVLACLCVEGAACARVKRKGGAMTVSMLWHICFCQLIENLLEVKFVVGRSGPIDVRHRVVLYDAALSLRKRSVAAEASEGTKGGERPVWSTLWIRKERRHATSQFTCLSLVCVFVASCGC